MNNQIREVLDQCGYQDMLATEQGLISCFLDYVDTGYFGNMDYLETVDLIAEGEITVNDMLINLRARS